jgi:hypothetical protein
MSLKEGKADRILYAEAIGYYQLFGKMTSTSWIPWQDQ